MYEEEGKAEGMMYESYIKELESIKKMQEYINDEDSAVRLTELELK
jgi:hypothetical protein